MWQIIAYIFIGATIFLLFVAYFLYEMLKGCQESKSSLWAELKNCRVESHYQSVKIERIKKKIKEIRKILTE